MPTSARPWDGPALSEEEHEMTLNEELSEEVRKEQIEMEQK